MAVFFYMSRSGDGWRNLAVDRYFLEHLNKDDIMLYFYINENAVIIGKHQNAWRECNLQVMERDGVQLVRRHTGGGAVFHDKNNLNFSFIMGEGLYDLDKQMDVIINAVGRFGLDAERSGRNDILIDGRKFSGNAFAIHHGMYSHHGTLLIDTDLNRLSGYLNVSEKKMRSKGVKSVRSRVCNLCEFDPSITMETMAEALREEFRREYGDYKEYSFSAQELEEIGDIYEKQSSWEWRIGRTPEFDYEFEERFSFGEMQLLFVVREGLVKEVTVFSDALDTDLTGKVKQRLTGVKFTVEELSSAVGGEEPELSEISAFLRSLAL